MQVYPAYTIEEIERTLSWRRIGLLINVWDGHMPTHHMIIRIEKILEKVNGISFGIEGDTGDPRTKDEKLIDKINQFGWSAGGER